VPYPHDQRGRGAHLSSRYSTQDATVELERQRHTASRDYVTEGGRRQCRRLSDYFASLLHFSPNIITHRPVLNADVREPDQRGRQDNVLNAVVAVGIPRQVVVIPLLSRQINTISD